MNNIYFYLILSVFLYFIFTRVLENFLVAQENFDPSLVPVSSIVTLAKVAQKLVNGNGTLTNPGNLQIGASTSAPGNLTVTGKTTVGIPTPSISNSETFNVIGTAKISGNTTLGGTLGVTGSITTSNSPAAGIYMAPRTGSGQTFALYNQDGTNTKLWNATGGDVLTVDTSGNTKVSGTLGVTGATTIGSTTAGTETFNVTGTAKITGNTNVVGTLGVTGNTTLSGTLSVTGNTILSTGNTYGGSLSLLQGSGTSGEAPYINFMQNNNTTRNAFIQASNTGITLSAPSTTITNNLTVGGTLCDSANSILFRNVSSGKCLSSDGTTITSKDCSRTDNTQYWIPNGVRFVHTNSGKCMTITENGESYNQTGVTKFGLAPCAITNWNQVFRWDTQTRRIRRWLNNFTDNGNGWITQIRLNPSNVLDLWDNNCENDCVWDVY